MMGPTITVWHVQTHGTYRKVSPSRGGRQGGLGLPSALAVASNTSSSSACRASITATSCSSFLRCSSCFRWAPRKARTRALEGARGGLSQETAPLPPKSGVMYSRPQTELSEIESS